MNHRLKFVVIALLVLTIATLIADPYRTKAQLKSMSARRSQAQDRIWASCEWGGECSGICQGGLCEPCPPERQVGAGEWR